MASENNSPLAEKKKHRAKVTQDRSRTTRRLIVKSALHFWTERGFNTGFEETTVDEIAEYAKISRATVYYYFPKKEDILRELGWVTAEEIYECAIRSLMTRRSVDEVIDEIMYLMGTKVSKSPRAAVNRMMQLQRFEHDYDRDSTAGGLSKALSVVLAHAREVGEIPDTANPRELAEILASIATGAMQKWTMVNDIDLIAALRRAGAFVLAGARATPQGYLPVANEKVA